MNAALAFLAIVVQANVVLAQANPAQDPAQTPAPAPTAKERVAALKASLAESQKALRSYEWIETTTVFMKGEEKAGTVKRCYWGADGKVQKVDIAPQPEPEKKRGIKGKIAQKKKAELTDYMKQAVELVKSYVPPDRDLIQKAQDAGNVSIHILEPNKRVQIEFKNYQVPGDSLKVEITLADNRLAGVSLATFLADKSSKDPVTMEVRMGTLEDGTTYSEETVLQAEAKKMKVVVTNSGYRKTPGG